MGVEVSGLNGSAVPTNLFALYLAIFWLWVFTVLGSAASRADEPVCGTAPAWTPCQLFPAGPSVADHSGNHDHEFFWILFNAYADEWNRMPPEDPRAPPTRRPESRYPRYR